MSFKDKFGISDSLIEAARQISQSQKPMKGSGGSDGTDGPSIEGPGAPEPDFLKQQKQKKEKSMMGMDSGGSDGISERVGSMDEPRAQQAAGQLNKPSDSFDPDEAQRRRDQNRANRPAGGTPVQLNRPSSFDSNRTPATSEALDPVGKEDGDVDNDGDKDKTDKYLLNRRKAISAAIKKEEVEQVDERALPKKTIQIRPAAYGMHEVLDLSADVTAKHPGTGEDLAPGDKITPDHVESLKNDGHSVDVISEDISEARFAKGQDVGKPGMMFKKIAAAAAKRYGSKEAGDRVAGAALKKVMSKEAVELNADNVEAAKMHDCATHVFHHTFGLGECLYSKHAEPDENGNIAWYDVMFEHGIERQVDTSSFRIVVSEMHGNSHPKKKKRKMAEAADDGVTMYPGAQQTAAPEMENGEEDDFDYEGEMAKSELMLVADKALKISMMLRDDSNLEAWVQSKITKAADYISSVYNYMQYNGSADSAGVTINPEMSTEEVENLDEISKAYKMMLKYKKKKKKANEEVELDEARGRPADEVTMMARKIQGNEKAHTAFKGMTKGKEIPANIIPDFRKRYGEKVKQVYNDHFGGKSDDGAVAAKPDLEETEHVMAQLGKVADNSGTKKYSVKHHISGETVSVEPKVAQHLLSKYQGMDKKEKEGYVANKVISHAKDIQSKVDAKREELKKASS